MERQLLQDTELRGSELYEIPVAPNLPLLEINLDEIKDFARAFRRSNVSSIDAFLFRRPNFNEIGKFAIAAHLCKLEKPDDLDSAQDDSHWYRFLWNQMIAQTEKAADILKNQIRFVSFNYDRSLERFLFGAAKNTYGITDNEAYNVCKSIEIIHVYGLLGNFHYAGDEHSRPYSNEPSARDLRIAAAGIRLIPEERRENEHFKRARGWFAQAQRICFLGFGFDPINCENLALSSVLESLKNQGKARPWIAASTYNFTDAEKEQAKRLVCPGHEWVPENSDNLMTLRRLGVLA